MGGLIACVNRLKAMGNEQITIGLFMASLIPLNITVTFMSLYYKMHKNVEL